MPIKEIRATGSDAQELATSLLQRARLADPLAGLWEAADIQWWWRRPRRSDDVEKLFWLDEDGPVAGVLLTSWTDTNWQCDPLLVPHVSAIDPADVWNRAMELATEHAPNGFTVPVGDDDRLFRDLAAQSGLIPGDRDHTAWMEPAGRPALRTPAEGFTIVDRTQRQHVPHPMRGRNGEDVAERLAQCPLYDPSLDLSVETADGEFAGYSLYWFDPVTRVGLVEPVRVEDAFQRKGLATAMLTTGIDRLFSRGATRVKISYESEAAAAVYHGIGFQDASTTTWYRMEPGR